MTQHKKWRQKRRLFSRRRRRGGKSSTKSRSLKGVKVPIHSCNPIQKNKLSDSCFTQPIVQSLVQIYNQKIESGHKIDIQKPAETQLKELKEKMQKACAKKSNQEYCVAKQLNQTKIIQQSFMPERVWQKPNEWLTNEDTDKVMALYEKAYPHCKYCGTMTIDFADIDKTAGCLSDFFCQYKIKYEQLKPYSQWGMIFNLDKYRQRGSHWVSLFFDFQVKPPIAFYFDSATTFGSKIPAQIQKLLDTVRKDHVDLKVLNNTKQHQKSNTECGVYSLFFNIAMMTQQIPYISQEPMSKEAVHELFLHGDIPDSFIQQYRNIFFTVGH